jgi:two-component system, response regulator / RNA-binding antiterminator
VHIALTAVTQSPAFQETVAPSMVLDRDLRIQGANPAYLGATGRSLDELAGAYIFDAFPDNPATPDADGERNLSASLEQVLRSSLRHHMWVQRYDVPGPTPDDDFVLKFWSPVNSPIRDDTGRVAGVLHHVEDVTSVWAPALGLSGHGTGEPTLAAHGVDPDAELRMAPQAQAAYAQAVNRNEQAYRQKAEEAEQLRHALASRVVIEQAKGAVMASRRCAPEEAFEILRTLARRSQRNIHEVAADVLDATRVESAPRQTSARNA